MRLKREIDALLPRIRECLLELYGDSMADLILYGSFAKETADEDSDIDIALVLKGAVNPFNEIDRIYDAIYDLMLESGELISIHPLSQQELQQSRWPLYEHVRTEGIRL